MREAQDAAQPPAGRTVRERFPAHYLARLPVERELETFMRLTSVAPIDRQRNRLFGLAGQLKGDAAPSRDLGLGTSSEWIERWAPRSSSPFRSRRREPGR